MGDSIDTILEAAAAEVDGAIFGESYSAALEQPGSYSDGATMGDLFSGSVVSVGLTASDQWTVRGERTLTIKNEVPRTFGIKGDPRVFELKGKD